MKYVYILIAEGIGINFEQTLTEFTTTCFLTEEKAKSLIPKFRALITDKSRIKALVDDHTLKIHVAKLEVVE